MIHILSTIKNNYIPSRLLLKSMIPDFKKKRNVVFSNLSLPFSSPGQCVYNQKLILELGGDFTSENQYAGMIMLAMTTVKGDAMSLFSNQEFLFGSFDCYFNSASICVFVA